MKLEISSFFKKYWILLLLVAVKMSLQLIVVNSVYEFFTILRAKGYYALGLYPVLLAFGAVFLEKYLSKKFVILAPLYIGLNLLFFIGVSKFLFPVLIPAEIAQNKQQFQRMGLLRWEDGENIQKLFRHFSKVTFVENPDAREKGTAVFLLTGATNEFKRIFKQEVERRRNELDCF
jgi:hypothetical protein